MHGAARFPPGEKPRGPAGRKRPVPHFPRRAQKSPSESFLTKGRLDARYHLLFAVRQMRTASSYPVTGTDRNRLPQRNRTGSPAPHVRQDFPVNAVSLFWSVRLGSHVPHSAAEAPLQPVRRSLCQSGVCTPLLHHLWHGGRTGAPLLLYGDAPPAGRGVRRFIHYNQWRCVCQEKITAK